MPAEPAKVTVRMYNVGFGDCFLLTFHYAPPLPRRGEVLRWSGGRRVAAVAGGPECSKDLGPLVARGAGCAGRSKGWNSRCHCRAAASAGLGPPLLRRPVPGPCVGARQPMPPLPAASAAVGARAVSSGQQSLDGTEHHGPRAASPGRGVPAREARRHRERPTAAPAPPHLLRWKEKARLPRTPLRQGRLFGGTGQRGGVELPGAAGVVGAQKAATAAKSLHSLLLCFCLWGGLRRPVAAVAGVGFRTVRPCAGEVGGTATTQKEAESA